jgi:hypothetical protein
VSIINAMLVRWSGGYTWALAQGSIDDYSRREGYLTVAASSRDEAVRIADALLANRATPDVAVTATLEPTGVGDVPYADFAVGDYIDAPNDAGDVASQRVVAFTVSEDETGNSIFVPELSSLRQVQEQIAQRWLKRMANGTLGGTSESAMPPRLVLPPKPKAATAPMTFSQLSGSAVTVGASGRYAPPHSLLALSLIASVTTAGSSDTVVDLLRNDVVVATVTLQAGSGRDSAIVDVSFGPTDYATVACTAAGAGAVGLVVQVPTV